MFVRLTGWKEVKDMVKGQVKSILNDDIESVVNAALNEVYKNDNFKGKIEKLIERKLNEKINIEVARELRKEEIYEPLLKKWFEDYMAGYGLELRVKDTARNMLY